jgi:hypothetical protein
MSTADSPTADVPGHVSHLLLRSIDSINRLPVEHRWEFTRRHPYYQTFWRQANAYRESPSSDPIELRLQEASSLILTAINVSQSVSPPDPATSADAIGATGLGQAWQGGAVSPANVRSLAVFLLGALPKAERAQFGRLLTESSEFEITDVDHIYPLLLRLMNLPGEVWNSAPNVPYISINLQAPQRAIVEAVETLVRQWKAERSIPETRRRDDKLDEYLVVWDMREGWGDGAYDGSREKRLDEIARELKVPLSTVANRYRSAFEYLTGHGYQPELWIRLFGPLKLSALFATSRARLTQHRPWRSRNLRPVAESVLLPGRHEANSVDHLESAGISTTDLDLIELQIDIQTLIERGDSDVQIVAELGSDGGIDPTALAAAIAVLRSRRAESL